MRRWWAGAGIVLLGVGLAGCDDDPFILEPGVPAPPVNLDGYYYGGSVTLTWELSSGWDGESFRVYGKRVSDRDHFLLAEVTSCVEGFCTYLDLNVVQDVTYNYFVAAVDPSSGNETASDLSIDIYVPVADPPPVPSGVDPVGLDDAVYVRWGDGARTAPDFAFYRVYLAAADGDYLLGETDSEGFLDQLALNGSTYRYYVTSVDTQGHESAGSGLGEATPRPDYDNEFIYVYQDVPSLAGFRFRDSEEEDPIVDGDSSQRHFRVEYDFDRWVLVPGPSAEVHRQGFPTTALRCGPAADFDCVDLPVAPASGYGFAPVELVPQTTFVIRYAANTGGTRYGAVRVELLGLDQEGNGIMIFDWAHQLQPNNRNLSPGGGPPASGS